MDAALAGGAGLAGVEVRAQDGIGKLGAGAAVVHVGLGPLDLELVQDAGQLGDLFLIEVELVREKT